jgi:hypothetical protein
LAYKPFLAASRLAVTSRLKRDDESGVVVPEVMGVPVTGRRLERIPVVVRFGGWTVSESCDRAWSKITA